MTFNIRLASVAERALRYVLVIFVPVSALTLAVAPVAASVAYGRELSPRPTCT
jgi:hypothetical protein